MAQGLKFVVKTDSLPEFMAGFLPPVADGLIGCFLFGSSLARSCVNWVDGRPNAKIVGRPTVAAHYLSVKSQSNYLELPFKNDQIATFSIIERNTDTLADTASRPTLLSAQESSRGILFQTNASGTRSMVVYEIDDATGLSVTSKTSTVTGSTSAWVNCIGDFDNVDQHLYNMTNGNSDTNDVRTAATKIRNSANNLFLGSGRIGAASLATSDLMVAQFWSRRLTSDERTAVKNWATAYGARRGITV